VIASGWLKESPGNASATAMDCAGGSDGMDTASGWRICAPAEEIAIAQMTGENSWGMGMRFIGSF